MDLQNVWTVAAKDFSIFRKKKNIIYSIIGFQLFVSIGLPLVVRFAGAKSGGIPAAVLPGLLDAFSFWFVIGTAILPTAIASYSLVGEKVEKSLEPLLATPTTEGEILLGKSLTAFIPAIVSTYASAVHVLHRQANLWQFGVSLLSELDHGDYSARGGSACTHL